MAEHGHINPTSSTFHQKMRIIQLVTFTDMVRMALLPNADQISSNCRLIRSSKVNTNACKAIASSKLSSHALAMLISRLCGVLTL